MILRAGTVAGARIELGEAGVAMRDERPHGPCLCEAERFLVPGGQ